VSQVHYSAAVFLFFIYNNKSKVNLEQKKKPEHYETQLKLKLVYKTRVKR
jgi:hypothetical protein